jgi:hypothetical protein
MQGCGHVTGRSTSAGTATEQEHAIREETHYAACAGALGFGHVKRYSGVPTLKLCVFQPLLWSDSVVSAGALGSNTKCYEWKLVMGSRVIIEEQQSDCFSIR